MHKAKYMLVGKPTFWGRRRWQELTASAVGGIKVCHTQYSHEAMYTSVLAILSVNGIPF